MKTYLFVFALLFSGHLVFAQSAQTDPDTALLNPLLREGDVFLQTNQAKAALSKFQLAWEHLRPLPPTEETIRCLNSICNAYTLLVELDSLAAFAERGYQYSKTLQAGGIIPKEDFSRHKASYYRISHQFSEAIAWQQQGLSYQIKHFSSKISPVADAYNAMGTTYMESGKYDSAMLMYTEMLRLRRTLPQNDRTTRIQIAKGLQNVGIILKEAGQLDSAIAKYEEALTICLAEKDADLEGRVLYNTGFAIELQGEKERALDYYQKAAAIFLKLYGEQHALYAIALNKMGSMYGDLEDYESALASHHRALAINIAKFGPDHPKVSISKSNLSLVLAKLGRSEEALKMAREAVEIVDRNIKEPQPLKIAAYRLLSARYHIAKIYPDSALYFAVKSEMESRQVYGDRSEATAMALTEKAIALDYPERQLEALEAIQEALIAASRTFNSRDCSQNPEPDDFFQNDGALLRLHSKALILANIYETSKQRKYLDMALASLERGNEVMQNQLRKMGDQSISDYNSNDYWGNLCKDGVGISLNYHQKFPEIEGLERCYTWMERDKSQKLLLSAKNARAKTYSGIPDSLLTLDAKLAQDLTQLEQQLQNAEEDRDSSAIFKLKNESIFTAKANRNTFIRHLERDYPDYFSLKYQNSPVSLEQVRAQLPANTLLLELSIQQNLKDSMLYLLAIRSTGETMMQQPMQNGLFNKISRLNTLLQNQSLVQTAKRKEFAQLSSELYAQFIQPIENQLVGIQKIIIIGEGITHLIPFEVLMPSAQDKPFPEMDFLIKRFEVSYHYSSTLWANTSTAKTDFVTDLFAFAPVFDQESPKANIQLFEPTNDSTRTFSADGRWSPLPWTEKEVRNINQIFSKQPKSNTKLLLRAEATEPNLKDNLERGARYIHLASHSFANLKQPKFSGIACSPDPKSTTDGTLVVGEIYNLRIPAELVVLSSCESGKGKLVQNEGQLGLNRAFLYAGVPNVLFSLWKVNDQTTSDFMVQFYQGLLKGQSFSSALRSAKLSLINDPVTAMPNYWSGFLLIGK